MRIFFLLTAFVLLGRMLSAQVDFDNYSHLRSEGAVPTDFSRKTAEKIEQELKNDIPDLSKRQERYFIEQVNYSIDELLKSGLVTYGDEVSRYLQTIGDRLCASDPELAGKLRFYTLNANEANAFSTHQGMVFVTTGLIAQMTSEAQLAYVLAHEIIHYREKHVLDLYGYVVDNKSLSYGEKSRFFSKYSRDNELEADLEGVRLYHDAGYAPQEVVKTFDVLIYSYLPFEEVYFPRDYFNTDKVYVPEKLFGRSARDISARSNYDDRYTSHPNIDKRRERLEKRIDSLSAWGTKLEETPGKFSVVRDICRYEFVMNCVYDEQHVEALYAIFLLEDTHSGSHFLKHCKSQVWLEMMKDEEAAGTGTLVYSSRRFQPNYEGEISSLATFIASLDENALKAIGLRIIYDESRDSTDALQLKMLDKATEILASNNSFELSDFSLKTFGQAVRDAEEQRIAQEKDTLGSRSRWNKYETIENRKAGLTTSYGIDSLKFYLYAISDIKRDSAFLKRFEAYRTQAREKQRKKEDYFVLTDAEQSEIDMEEYQRELHLSLGKLLMINPLVAEFKNLQTVDYPGSDKLETRLLAAIQKMSVEQNIDLVRLDREHQEKLTTQEYNDLAVLMRSMQKAADGNEPDVFLLDQSDLDSIRVKYGSQHAMLTMLEHTYQSGINAGNGVLFTVLFPVGLVYFPIAILSGNKTYVSYYILDLGKGELVAKREYFTNDPASSKILQNSFYALFSELKQPKE
jgi:beta-barrel assembly-enhancing protease